MIEQEIKLACDTLEAARRMVESTGARLVVSRRLIDDGLYDTVDRQLAARGTALRLRKDEQRTFITFKGPVRPGPVKAREEHETAVGDARIGELILTGLGYQRWFRAQKYREEYALDDALVVIDDTPIGVFIEIEGSVESIDRTASQLGRSRADYRLESYAALYRQWCQARGVMPSDMVF